MKPWPLPNKPVSTAHKSLQSVSSTMVLEQEAHSLVRMMKISLVFEGLLDFRCQARSKSGQ